MKKDEEQPRPAGKHDAGMTNGYTGNSVLNRTLINSPANEGRLRGITYTREELVHEHKHGMPLMPLAMFAEFLESHGATILDEVA